MKKLAVSVFVFISIFFIRHAKAESTLSAVPGYRTFPVVTAAGDPGAYSAGINAFDRDEGGTLYIFTQNQVIKDPAGTADVLFDYQTDATVYGSFITVRGETVYFGESSTGTVRSVPSDGGPASRLFRVPGFRAMPPRMRTGLDFTLTGNFACAFNSQSQMFLSANPGGFVPENKIYYWDGLSDPVIIADMGGYSGPIAFDRDDNLYYGFTNYPAGPEDVVYFAAAEVGDAISSGVPLGSSDWTVLASGVDACSGLVLDDNGAQNLYSASSLGTITRIDGSGAIGLLGGGDSPSSLSFSPAGDDFTAFNPGGGRLSVLCTDWLDYSSTIFAVEPSGQNFILDGGDYDGSGGSDIAVFRPATGLWAIQGVSRIYFGGLNDLPVAGDYNADGIAEAGIFRPSTGLWAIRGVSRLYFGNKNDIPIPRDYDGDGTGDQAVFRPGTGLWAIRDQTRIYLGQEGDYPVPAEYGGAMRVGIFRSATGLWTIEGLTRFYYGRRGDIPVPGDYDADGTAEAGIFRPADGLWAVRGLSRIYFGTGSDIPLPLDINPSTAGDIGIFRPSTGLWAIRGFTRAYYGGGEDYPVSR